MQSLIHKYQHFNCQSSRHGGMSPFGGLIFVIPLPSGEPLKRRKGEKRKIILSCTYVGQMIQVKKEATELHKAVFVKFYSRLTSLSKVRWL